MRVSTVSENRIDIHLSSNELYDIFGGYEYINYGEKDCRAKIHRLICALVPEIFPLDCKKIMIEVRPANHGCTISVIKLYGESTLTMIYETSEDLISSVRFLKELICKNSALYTDGKKYAVICAVLPFESKTFVHIGEYCRISQRQIDAVIINEYWQPICKEDAITKLVKAFL